MLRTEGRKLKEQFIEGIYLRSAINWSFLERAYRVKPEGFCFLSALFPPFRLFGSGSPGLSRGHARRKGVENARAGEIGRLKGRFIYVFKNSINLIC